MNDPPQTAGSRVARALLGALLFGVAAPVLMGITGFAVAASIPGRGGEYAGYSTIALCFVGIPVGAVVGFLVSVIATPPRLALRWSVTAALFALAGGVIAYSSVPH